MHGRVFLLLLITLISLSGLSRPALWRPLLAAAPTAGATTTPAPPTFTPNPTPDYLAHVPTATPFGRGGAVLQPLPALGDMPPTFAPTPAMTAPTATVPTPPTPPRKAMPIAPERLQIPRLGLDAPIEPAALIPSAVAPGIYDWTVPDHRAAGWLNHSAAFGQAGNTVLAGHHNIAGEVFRDIWTLLPGDDIGLWAGTEQRLYQVAEVLILPERDQPLDARLANAQYLQPTGDDRLTLITCWPYNDNSHRAIVIARPVNGATP